MAQEIVTVKYRASIAAAAMLLCICGRADAAVYWGNGLPIGRANLDGTHQDHFFIPDGPSAGGASLGCGGVAANASHIFWAEPVRGAIGRANIDGSSPEYNFITGAQNPCGIAVNGSHIYWTNRTGNSIGRATLGGSDVDQTFLAISKPCGIAVNESFIYWSGNDPTYIGRALIAGPTRGPDIYEGSSAYNLCGIAVSESHVFWGGFGDVIGRADLNGANVDDSFIEGIERPCGLAVDGQNVYWTENTVNGGVGRANLDGQFLHRDIIGNLPYSCGVAVDSRTVGPAFVLPNREPAPCAIEAVRFNKRKGYAFVRVKGPLRGAPRALTRGLTGRVLSKGPPGHVVDGTWRYWIKVRPVDIGQAARRINSSLGTRGRARVHLRIRCEESGKKPTTIVRKIVLRRSR